MIYAFKDHLDLKHFLNTLQVCFTFANLLEHALRARQHLVAFMQQACFAFETDLNNARVHPPLWYPLWTHSKVSFRLLKNFRSMQHVL